MADGNVVFSRNIYNMSLIELYQAKSLSNNIANGKYSMTAVKGDQVINDSIDDFTSSEYNGTMVYQEIGNTSQTVLIDKEEQIGVNIRVGNQWLVNWDLQEKSKNKAAKQFVKVVDTYNLLQMRNGAGEVLDLEGTTLTSSNIIAELITPINIIFNENDVDEDDRILVVTPAIEALFTELDIFKKEDGLQAAGYGGTIAGIRIYRSNLLPANANTPALTDCVALQKDAYEFATGLTVGKVLDATTFVGKQLQELMVYGGDVLDVLDKGVIKISFDETV